ncbi:hypothetical protein, partial [Streptomyces sp. NPDC060205]|uniref:hypothetical protein n=1 Tax=Streptomyces sp. NPDC060205 TaxID=3347072 RepID=UPI003664E913
MAGPLSDVDLLIRSPYGGLRNGFLYGLAGPVAHVFTCGPVGAGRAVPRAPGGWGFAGTSGAGRTWLAA